MEPLPRVGSPRLSLLATEAEIEEDRQMLEAEAAARGEAFQRNLPGEICRCLQEILPHVRRALEQSDLQRFADEREAIVAISDEVTSQPWRAHFIISIPRNQGQGGDAILNFDLGSGNLVAVLDGWGDMLYAGRSAC